jgi:hypothetical protein
VPEPSRQAAKPGDVTAQLYSVFKAYAVKNRAAIMDLTTKIPYLCIATYKEDEVLTFDTLLEPFRDYIALVAKLKAPEFI